MSGDWQKYYTLKAKHSHRIMAWCGVAIYPAFGILDFLVVEDWKMFLLVRVVGAILMILLLLGDKIVAFSSEAIAHISCQIVFVSLIWMLSQLDSPHLFSIYALNSCTAFIASAIFLLWKPKHSLYLVVTVATSFVVLMGLYSPLSAFEIITSGTFVLITVVILSQLYVLFRYRMTRKDFKRQDYLNKIITELRTKNFQIEKQHDEIRVQHEKLDELNQLKDKLLMIISHDFRSPLHSLKGVLAIIDESESITLSEFKYMANGIRHNLEFTYSLLESLLYWAKSQMNGFVVTAQLFGVAGLVDNVMSGLEFAARKKQLVIINQCVNDHIAIADLEMIRIVLRNLISNAIKFSSPGDTILIESKRRSLCVEISVADSGIGMTPEELSKLFNVKSYSTREGTNKEKGTGLGLLFCKDLLERNQGSLQVHSELGKGSVFTIALPCGTAAQQGMHVATAVVKEEKFDSVPK